jgi:hypothetical protein
MGHIWGFAGHWKFLCSTFLVRRESTDWFSSHNTVYLIYILRAFENKL